MIQQLKLIAVLVFIGFTLQSAMSQESQDGAVEFTLTVAGSSAPLPGGSILMTGPIAAGQQSAPSRPLPQLIATTDMDGHASFRNLAPGRYMVSVEKKG
jgi:hypothetical protein